MNILPLVSAFILLFAIGSYTFIHQFRAAVQEKNSYEGSMRLARSYESRLQRKYYNNQSGEPRFPKKKREGSQPSKKTQYNSPRDSKNPSPESKLFIASLATEENPFLEEVAIDLINRLYFATLVKVNGQTLLNEIVTALKEDSSIDSMEKLLAHFSKEKASYLYKIVKGTNAYEFSTANGIPPLGDFISLEKKTTKAAIHFSSASRPVLLALFGDVLAPQIIQEEKLKWEPEHKHAPLNKGELEALLLKHRKSPSDFEKLINFTTKKAASTSCLLSDNDSKLRLKFTK